MCQKGLPSLFIRTEGGKEQSRALLREDERGGGLVGRSLAVGRCRWVARCKKRKEKEEEDMAPP